MGDTLVSKDILQVYRKKGLELKERVTDGASGREYIMEPHNLPFEKKDRKGNKYYQADGRHYYVRDKMFGGGTIPQNGEYLVVDRKGNFSMTGYYDLTAPGKLTNQRPKHRIGTLYDKDSQSFSQQLIYNGKVGSNIRIIYREFSGSMIRSSFDQELQYDLSESKTIGFRKLRIEVLSATNTEIKYKVIKHFPDYR